jgi:hypothetical protein
MTSPLVIAVTLLLAACASPDDTGSDDRTAPDTAALLADALSATYPAHAARATVVDWEGNVLQEGDNGFTCMPTPPPVAARGDKAPMCLDSVWLEWAQAWQNKEPFSTNQFGVAYMLTGDGGASNIDPFAESPTDDNDWVVEGAHLMLIAPDPSLLADIPTDPTNGGPYVMWRGTDFEHVMVPVKSGGPSPGPAASPLEDALSAADVDMQAMSTVVDWEGNTLQEGDNGYTCMPTPPPFAERGAVAPMCFDKTWLGWADAWQNRKPFSTELLGISYMLSGDGGASNIDPFAEGPTDDNEWVEEAPHLMVVLPNLEMLSAMPRDLAEGGGPYVMWDSTDYVHVMIPLGDRD